MSITLLCPSCKKDVQPDRNLMCPNCGELLENEILDMSLSTNSDYILIYNEDDSIGQANLKTISPKHQLGKNALILKVTKEFFDLLTPEIHDRSTKNSPFGAVPISRHSNETQAILNMLKSHAIKYSDLKNKTESFAEEFKLYETMWESIASVNDDNFIEENDAEIKPVYITNTLGQKVNLSNPEEFETEVARQVERYKDSLVKSLTGELTRKYRLKEIKNYFAGNQEAWFKTKVEYFENTLRNNFNLTVEREQ